MGTGGGPAFPEIKNQIEVAVPHLTYEVSHNLDSDGAYLPILKNIPSSSSLSEDIEMAITEENLINVPDKTSDLGAPSEAPITSAKISGEKRTLKRKRSETRETATNSIISVRLKNIEAEKIQADQLHAIRMQIAEEDLETAKLKRRAAKLQLLVAEMDLERMKTSL